MFSSFDNLDKEILNLNDVVIKDLQVESQRLCNKINNLEKKKKTTTLISLEENSNFLEQYVKGMNNLEITGVAGDVEDQNLEEKVIEILDKIDLNVSSQDIEACHHTEK